MAGEWLVIQFGQLLAEPVRNGIYKQKEFHGRGAKIVNMGELFAHPRLRAVPMKRVALSDSEAARFTLAEGDLLFARRSLVAEGAGKCSVVLDIDEPTTFESSIIRARPDRTKADPHFLYYFFNSTSGLHCLDTIRRQVAVAGITGSDLVKLELAVPPLPEQRAIAHILGTLDDKIELNRKLSETLEGMARALFKSWFVDFDPVRAKMDGRDPGLPKEIADLFPSRMVESEVGEIPEGWRVTPFAETVEILGGGTPKTSVAEYWDGDIPWFSVVDAPEISNVWVVNTEKKVTRAGVENSSSRVLPEGTTIISARGTVGRIALVGVPMAMNQSCYGLRGRTGARGYFTHFATGELISSLQQRAHGSVFDTITRDTLASISVVEPPAALVESFEFRVGPMLERIRLGLFSSGSLTALRDALLPKLISGQIRVSTAMKHVEEAIA
jgi:type I restriction enzyme S subunit